MELLQALFDQVPLMLAIWDTGGRCVHANRALEHVLGWNARDDLMHEAFGACHPDPLHRREILSGLRAGYEGWRDFRVRTRWGHDLDTRWAVLRLSDSTRLGIGEDVSRRKEDEERLREQATVLDSARDAIIVCDRENRIISWNRAAERLYGWAAVEVLGLRLGGVVGRQAHEPDRTGIDAALLERGEWHGELEQETRSGEGIVVESSLTLLRDSEGQPRGQLAINTDITEKKRLERQLMAAQRLESLGRLAGGIADDLTNVLTPLRLGIDFLLARPDDPSRRSILRTLQAGVRRGADMVQQIQAFARGGGGPRRAVELGVVLQDAEKMLRPALPRSIALDVFADPDLWPVMGDASQLSQMLLSLCVNARDAMRDGGTLAVRAENSALMVGEQPHPEAQPGRYVRLTVADTGCGMAPGVLERAFDPFFTTREIGAGAGLGLSAVRGMVRGHGGFIEGESAAGAGTTFRVWLPAAEPLAEGAGVREGLPTGCGQWVLVVEDESAIRALARTMLETFGYRVLTAANGQEALALFREHRVGVRLALVDLMLPVLDGPATIQALRALAPRLAVIATSGLDAAAPAGTVPLTLQGFLRKPYSARALLGAIRRVLGPAAPAV